MTIIVKMILLKSICISLMLIFGFSQQYPICMESSTIDTSNASNTYSNHIIALTGFVFSDQSDLYSAAEQYIANGSNQKMNSILKNNRTLYIILTVFLSLICLIIFIVLMKIGSLQLTSKQIFEKRKEKGYSSPLSLLFTLVAIILFITTCFNAYTIPTMILDLDNTLCIMDGLNYAFISGSPQNNWDGVNNFVNKITEANQILSSLGKLLNSSYEVELNTTDIAQINFGSLKGQYLSIKNQFLRAQIIANSQNASQNINLTTLIPNLSASDNTSNNGIFSTLQTYLNTIQSSISAFSQLQHFFNDSYPYINSTMATLSAQKIEISQEEKQFSADYQYFRLTTSNFFSDSYQILIFCEFITVATVIGSLISIIIMRLIQSSYDYFSLKAYKIIWTCHIIAFCLNLIFLMIIDQVYLFSQGICEVSTNMINNQTLIETLLPQSTSDSGLYLFASCLFNSDFTQITQTNSSLYMVSAFLSLKDQISNEYNYLSLGQYPDIINNFTQQLLPYKFGYQGSYAQINHQLSKINNITFNNIYNQNCFKHHWEFAPSNCQSSQNIIIMPTIPFPYASPANYNLLSSSCYLLNDYTSSNPTTINISTFLSLYSEFTKKCPLSMAAIRRPVRQFFIAESVKQAVIDNLINQISNLSPLFRNIAQMLVNDTISQTTFLKTIFNNFTIIPSHSTIFEGNNCTVISSYVYGIYNKFCVDFLSKTHQVYLLTVCNLIYSVILIILSLLYAIELQSFPEKDEQSQASQQQANFDKTSSVMLSDNHQPSHSSEIQSQNSSQKLSYQSSEIKYEDER